MPNQHPERVCAVCSSSFFPRRINSVACTPKCGKRAEMLRAKARAYDVGLRNITAETLQAALSVLEADAVVSAVRWLEGETEDASNTEAERHRNIEARVARVDRQWAKSMSDALQRKRDGGWRPLGSSPSPFQGERKIFHLKLPAQGPRHAP